MSDVPQLPDMGSLFGMAMEMQQQMVAAQESLLDAVVEGQAGGGVVRVVVTGAMDFRSITIAPEAVDPDDVEMLQDLVLAAIHDAVAAVNALQVDAMGPLGTVDLSSLGVMELGAAFGSDDDDDEDEDDDQDEDDEDDGGEVAG